MEHKYIFVMVFVAVLALGIASTQALPNNTQLERLYQMLDSMDGDFADIRINRIAPLNIEEYKETLADAIPASYEEAAGKIEVIEDTSVMPRPYKPNRFIMWTYDGGHVMWGTFGNGYFAGEDNTGEKVWGIYRNGKFAGFYDEELFYGRYNNDRWKAMDLFGEYSYGEYRLFPQWRTRVSPVWPMPYEGPIPLDDDTEIAPGWPSPEEPPYKWGRCITPGFPTPNNDWPTLKGRDSAPVGPFKSLLYW